MIRHLIFNAGVGVAIGMGSSAILFALACMAADAFGTPLTQRELDWFHLNIAALLLTAAAGAILALIAYLDLKGGD